MFALKPRSYWLQAPSSGIVGRKSKWLLTESIDYNLDWNSKWEINPIGKGSEKSGAI